MPLGISESLIQKAYAPIDLSGFYKNINQASLLAAKQRAEEKRVLQKEFATTVAAFNKNLNGISAADSSEINQHFFNWKNLTQKRNSLSFDRNPDEWAKLNEEANSEYGLTLTKSELSKTNKKQEQANLAHIRSHPTDYIEGAAGAYTKFLYAPSSKSMEIGEDGLSENDISRFQYKGAPVKALSDLNTKLSGKDAYSGAHVISKKTEYGVVAHEYQIPDVKQISGIVTDFITIYPKEAPYYVKNNKALIENTQQNWANVPESYFDGFKILDTKTGNMVNKYPADPVTGLKKPILPFDTPENMMISTIAARAIMEKQPKQGKDVSYYKEGEIGKYKTIKEINQEYAKELINLRDTHTKENMREREGYKLTDDITVKKIIALEAAKYAILKDKGIQATRNFTINNPDATDEEVQAFTKKQLEMLEKEKPSGDKINKDIPIEKPKPGINPPKSIPKPY